MRAVLVAAVLTPCAAAAYEDPGFWLDAPDGPVPGGGAFYTTGGHQASGLTCASCHLKPVGQARFTITFTPALAAGTSAAAVYVPNTRYRIDVRLQNQTLTCAGGCDKNGFVATVEAAQGQPLGVLEDDTGVRADACPNLGSYPADGGSSTTMLPGNCQVVMSRWPCGAPTAWAFYWRAPPAGSGTATLHLGGVDGNCDKRSEGDDAVHVVRTIPEQGTAARPAAQPRSRWAWVGFVFALGSGVALRRARSK